MGWWSGNEVNEWWSGNGFTSHCCYPGLIPGFGMWDGHVVTKSDTLVSSRYSCLLPHQDHTNANISANKNDLFTWYNLHSDCCKINIVKINNINNKGYQCTLLYPRLNIQTINMQVILDHFTTLVIYCFVKF